MKGILITSSVLIVALILLRLLFSKKVSRTLIYGAWILVALRLLIPVQIGQLSFSVLTATQDVQQTLEQVATQPVSGPSKQEVYQDIVVDYVQKDPSVFIPQVQEQIREEVSHGATNPAEIMDKIQQKYPQQELFTPEVEQQVQQQVAQTKTAPTLGQIAKVVWLVGVAGMALWFAIVNLRHGWLLRGHARKLDCRSAIPVYVSEKVGSPCLVGLLRPVIYVTPRCAENEALLRHVLKHELTHYRHGDHIWSLVRCICLCVYWFDPLVWAAAYLSRRDCELACDEGAMKGLDEADRLAYGKTLLEVVSHAASPGKLLHTATSMNETMKQLKERVNFIVRKPKFSITAAISMVLICAIVAGCAVAGPTSGHSDPPTTTPTTIPTTTPTTSPSTSGSTQPTDPKPTDPQPTEPTQTLPSAPVEVLAEFNALFGDVYSWYNKTLTCEYTTPEQIMLSIFFLSEFPEESNQVTDSERAQLKDLYGYSDYIDMIHITRLPVDKMNQVLQQYFGITLEDVEAAGFHGLNYLESTNCYYIVGGGAAAAMNFKALSVENMKDGSLRVTYTQFTGSNDEMFVATLMPHGDGYRILSNVLLSDPAQDLYALEAELAQRIEDAWHQETRFGYQDTQAFCSPTGTEDGIRYYGSYMLGDTRYDIVYIPCADLAIPSEITLGGYTFRSRTGFALYAFSSKELPSLGMTMSIFTPLKEVVNAVSVSSFDVVLATAAKLHGEYERRIYGSELTEIPQAGPDQNMLRLKALWLMHCGSVPDFDTGHWLCYYGSYNGYDIIFEQTMLTAQLTITIGGEKFVYSSHFIIHAIKDGEFYKLQDVYAAGSISREDIAQIAAEHKSQHGHLTQEHPE